ncbi:kynureninase [uncultured Alsobacter sp.]|uniref:kynureninase n=1 Tax=uncultured Alsobacter sp. TaxID=1748258 RepID=UPI0025D9421A|nr:kynureninase [uncultured Alsobacter sp.]
MITQTTLAALDAADPLAHCRERFHLPDGVLYFDGNSLGPLPRGVPARMKTVVEEQWGEGLIRSWNTAGWMDLPARVGGRIASLVGAEPGSIISADSTSVNLFKLVCAALALNPGRPEILSDSGNFPTDLYVASGAAQIIGRDHRLKVVEPQDVAEAIGPSTAVVMLTHVDYRTGQMHDMEAITARAHAAGAIVIWDLAHSTGAMPVDLAGCKVDLAVGCSYKYLNGGPGAPAWLYVAPRHQAAVHSPLTGWLGHAAPFAFDLGYRPADGIARFICGTPNILSLAALDASLDAFDGVDMRLVRAKSIRLGDLFIGLVEQELGAAGFGLGSPRDGTARGSQVSLTHPQGYAIMQALISRGVIGDFRAPDVLRFGFCPLYARFSDLWGLVGHLREIMATEEWNQEMFLRRARVT